MKRRKEGDKKERERWSLEDKEALKEGKERDI